MAISKKKKKNIVTLVILLLLLAGAIVAFVIINNKNKQKGGETETKEAREQVFSLDKDSIIELEYRIDGETMTFVRVNSDDTWKVKGQEKVSIKQTSVSSLLNYVMMMNIQNSYADNLSEQEEFGLGADADYVSVKASDGKSEKLRFGDATPASSGYYYANVDGTDSIIAVVGTARNRMLTDINSFTSASVYPSLEMNDMTEIIYSDKNQSIELYNEPADLTLGYAIGTTTWYYKYKGKYMATNYDESLEVLGVVAKLDFTNCVEFDAASNLKKYGLDDPFGRLTVKYSQTDEETQETNSGVVKVLIGDMSEDQTGRYIMIENDDKIYAASAEKMGLLTDHILSDYLMSLFPALCNFDGIKSIDVVSGDKKLNIEVTQTKGTDADGNEKIDYACKVNGEATEEKATRNLFANLIRISADHIIPDGEAKPADDVVFRCAYHTSFEDRPEIVYEISPLDGTYYQVSLDGDTKYAITKQEFNALQTNLAEYLR